MINRCVENWRTVTALLAVVVLAGCGGVSLESTYRDHEIVIDGSYEDWWQLEYKEKLGVSVGVMNDDDFVYVIIVVRNNELQRRIFLNGMILWFDPAGEKTEQFGIHYPMGLPQDPSKQPTQLRPRPTPDELAERRGKMLAEYEVIAEAGKVRKVSGVTIHDVPGIEVNSGGANGMSVFEYKIPLKSTGDIPYAIGSGPGAIIGLGLVTPELYREQSESGSYAPGGGSRGGSYGGSPGGSRTRRGTQPMSMAGPVNVWGTLQLSAN